MLNANYLRACLGETWHVAYDRICMHEVIISDRHLKETGVTTMDVAKRLIDYGFHAPTVYFPLVVKGAMLIEPTETESMQTLDEFVDVMKTISEEARSTRPRESRTQDHALASARRDPCGPEARSALESSPRHGANHRLLLMKRQKRGLEAVDDDAVNVVAVEAHLRMGKPELTRDSGIRDQAVVGVDRHAQSEVVIELERMRAQILDGAGLHVR